jgi:transcriptional regulator with PAS, ATPase and Fis domain
MMNCLVCWIGRTDLRAPAESDEIGLGPIAQAVESDEYDTVDLLADYPEEQVAPYISWLKKQTSTDIQVHRAPLTSPTDFGEIYQIAHRIVTEALGRSNEKPALTFHLSPGTPAMAAVWILLAKTLFPANLIESSKERGVRIASVPFDISAEFLPHLLRESDERLEKLSAGLPPEAPAFADIVHQSPPMKRLMARAQLVALRAIPVLIEGASGTGKELLARAIHTAGPRRDRPFLTVNCGAIPAELVESELFGYEKGAFTGATKMKKGYFEAANGGTLFLDEIGELPAPAQVKLLRVLQEGEITRVGAVLPLEIDVRIIAATNCKLHEEVAAERFREDLFYRLAVAVLQVPTLGDRPGDLGLLIDHLLEQIHQQHTDTPGYKRKEITAGARNLLLQQSWPGNIRELINTLQRAVMWSTGPSIDLDDVREALLPPPKAAASDILDRPLGQNFDIQEILTSVAQHYLRRALNEAGGNKTKAATLIGLPSYQTLTNWLQKYDVSV